MTAEAIIIIGTVLAFLFVRWLVRNHGDLTLACLFGRHEGCNQHLRCSCQHHDVYIHEKMRL